MKQVYRKILTFLLLLTICFQSKTKVIIWDVGKTLAYTSRIGMGMAQCGLGSCLSYMILTGQSPVTLREKTLKVVELAAGLQEGNDCEVACYDDGTHFPKLICQWQAGIKTPEECKIEALRCLEELSLGENTFFYNNLEKKIVARAIEGMFDPETLIRHTYLIKPGIKLLKDCAQSGEHTNMILSNWDAGSFEIFLASKKGQEILKYIDPAHIVISGKVGLLKPHPSLFEYVLAYYKLDPSECIFIDDQEENIKAAQACGIITLHLKNGDYKKLRQDLQELGVL